MTGYLLTIISIGFSLLCQTKISYSQFNLYNTEESLMMNTFGYHCLYFSQEDISNPENSIVSFCLRPETLKQSNDASKSCYGEKTITFKELKLNNVSVVDLFQWNAVIEIIDLYEKYLLLPDLVLGNESYCNCSSLSQFGKSCQYEFNLIDPYDDEQSFTKIYYNGEVGATPNKEMINKYVTCYIGIQCQTKFLCLDWRQICNGVVDCDHGEDEPFELCLQMELNQCNAETEFRCNNGLCIPTVLGYELVDGCPDRSDGTAIYNTDSTDYLLFACSAYPNLECDEFNHGWKQFSCGDGQFISYSDLTLRTAKDSKTCTNKRNLIYLKQLFSPNNEDQCWKSMICLTGFDYLYSNIICLNETIEINIKQHCPNEYYFPSNSVVYSFVFFLYEKMNRIDWFNYTGPNYICYKKEFCDKHILKLPTILKNNLTCFYVNQTIFSWKNFYEHIIYLFSSCYSNVSTTLLINDKMLYKCNLSDTFISIHRVKDKTKDCFFNEDENSNMDLCLLNTNDHFKCLTNEKECIRRSFLNDKQYDCSDGSDEYFPKLSYLCGDDSCAFHSQQQRTLPQIYRFEELCDQIVNRHIFSNEANETDETDCEYWPFTCDSLYTKCNQIWNCKNGLDEINCPSRSLNYYIKTAFHCKTNEHYCLQLINDNNDVNMTCININKAGDGIIDCIGGTDERLTNICTDQSYLDFKRRFHCMNSSKCIEPNQVCNRISDCPFEDDERICPWLFKNNSTKFYCNNSVLHPANRCDKPLTTDRNCQVRENIWFCDLGLGSQKTADSPAPSFQAFPKISQTVKSISFENINTNKFLLSETRTLSLININTDLWLCNKGYPVQSLISNDASYCLCPPSYYGDYCQHQSERLTIIIKIQIRYYINPLTVFRLIIYLLNENNVIISHDEIVYNHKSYDFDKHFVVYLMNERMRNVSLHQRVKSKFVRIDSYIIKDTNIQYISSWLFHVSFPFLPVNRLVVLLYMENELFKIVNCKKRCGSHGKCMYYVNSRNTEYCWCEQGWFGEECHSKSSSNLCSETSCAPHSQCVILNNENKQSKCICPLGKSGNQCYIKHNSCSNVVCQNNGTCIPLDQRNFGYFCICTDDYDGTYCSNPIKFSYIFIDANISYLSPIPVIIVIFGRQTDNVFKQNRIIRTDVSLPAALRMTGIVHFGFVQMFHNVSKSFYYVVVIQQPAAPYINTSVTASNLCQNVSELFNETILYEYSYLKRLKLYHLPCRQNKDLRCFFDEYRMCLCTRSQNSDCYLFYHEYSNCDYCENGGLCLRRNPAEGQWDYKCLCSECSFGTLCQFSTGNYFITLDILIGIEIKTENASFNDQSFIIYLTLIILILILLGSLILNIISMIVFSNKNLRQVGCDIYLLNLTILSQIGLILLFLRFLYMIIIQIYIIENLLFIQISCILLEYLTRLIPSLFDWLTVCISIERAYTVIKDVQFTKLVALKTYKISRWIILIVFLFNILTTLHRPFYLILVDEPTLNGRKQGHPWCVLDFNSNSWNIYEKFINIFHLVTPLVLNIMSIVFFLYYKTKSDLKSTVRNTESSKLLVLKQQLFKYKPLLISTIIIIILEIPRFVLTFTLVCIRHKWQRYVYLTGYLISFLPLTGILFIYIMPSPKYKKQFQTVITKKFFTSLFKNE